MENKNVKNDQVTKSNMQKCMICKQLVPEEQLSLQVCRSCHYQLNDDFYSQISDYTIDDSQEIWATKD